MEGKAIAFVKPDQIVEILKETQKLKLDVIVRYSQNGKGVRAQVAMLNLKDTPCLKLDGISVAGDKVLTGVKTVRVEFVLLSKKVYFVAQIIGKSRSWVSVSIPNKIVALERRSNMRFTVPKELVGFVEVESRRIDGSRWDAPFIPPTSKKKDNFFPLKIRIDDVSLGGVGVFTYYRAVADQLHPDKGDVLARILLPGMEPFVVPVSVRWTKKSSIRVLPEKYSNFRTVMVERLNSAGVNSCEVELMETFTRIGLQFSEIPGELDRGLRIFMKKIQTLETV